MLIDAFHAALENGIEALDGIGMNGTANVFLFRVNDGFMGGELAIL